MDELGGGLMLSRRRFMNDRIVSESGNNLVMQNVKGSKLNALTVYGHSTQDGTPSPDNPVPIASAGSVMTTGAQLFDFKNADVVNMYIANSGIGEFPQNWSVVIPISPNTSYTISEKNNNTIRAALLSEYPYDGIQALYKVVISQYDNIVIPYGYEANYLMIQMYGDFTDEPDFSGIMLNSGSTALPWEPYTGGVPGVNPYEGEINVSISDNGTQSQTLTISTPGGLPGIPVSSGGNYTDENGHQWICDEIDLARGKYVQRTDEVVLSSTNISLEYAKQDTNLFSIPTVHLPSPASNISTLGGNFILSNIQPPGENDAFNSNIPGVVYTNGSNFLRINILNSGVGESLDTFKDFLDDMEQEGNPAKILYIIATPIETDIPAEEIAAYKALHTYSPATTVSNDAGAWMKVGYREWRR